MSVLSTSCAAMSVGLGATYMLLAGAPQRYVLINAATLALGLAAARVVRHFPVRDHRSSGGVVLAIGLLLLATAFIGVRIDGASRWVRVAGIALQPSLILLPFAILQFAQNRNWWSSIGLALAAAALGAQPDRAMAGTLAAALAALALYRRELPVIAALAAAVLGFSSTLLSADTVAPVPFVEKVVQSAFAFHILTGVATVLGLAILLVPALIQFRRAENKVTLIVFAVTWLAVIVFALVANYPTPVVGYGSSAILGYCLSAVVAPSPRTSLNIPDRLSPSSEVRHIEALK